MAEKVPELHEVAPREQAGVRTGAAFEYQYHQAAAEALALLDDHEVVCVYCEWHDDYVAEVAKSGTYNFHQVKTRAKSAGPWRLSEFFGLPRGKGPAAKDSPFARLWDHVIKFGSRCSRFIFVSDVGVRKDLESLVKQARTVDGPVDLSAANAKSFARVLESISPTFDLTKELLFEFLTKLYVQEGVGSMNDLNGCQITIINRIMQASEVDLSMEDARKIGAELVTAVRVRSHRMLELPPTSTDELRRLKGLVIENLLPLLSLSVDGYRQLRTGGLAAVKSLSRLQRLCERSGVPLNLVADLCGFKSAWDVWWLDEQHNVMDMADYVAFKWECANLLLSHSKGLLPFDQLVQQAKSLAEKFRTTLGASEPLTGQLVLGQIAALAAEAEP